MKLFELCVAQDELRKKSDAEIALLVQDHLWANTSMLSAESTLLESVIERLERTGAGPYIPSEEHDEQESNKENDQGSTSSGGSIPEGQNKVKC